MKYKMTIIFIILNMLFYSVQVYASVSEISASVETTSKMVTISGTGFEDGDTVLIIVESPIKSMDYIGTEHVSNGDFILSYVLDDPQEGTYKVRAKVNGGNVIETEFAFNSSNAGIVLKLYAAGDEIYKFPVIGKKNNSFKIKFDPDYFVIKDLCCDTEYEEKETGLINERVNITYVTEDGFEYTILSEDEFTNAFNLYAKKEGQTKIEIYETGGEVNE